MNSISESGGHERVEALATEWAHGIYNDMKSSGWHEPGSAFDDEAERRIQALTRDLRIDKSFACVLAVLTMRETVRVLTGSRA